MLAVAFGPPSMVIRAPGVVVGGVGRWATVVGVAARVTVKLAVATVVVVVVKGASTAASGFCAEVHRI
jgi:hypothetical protein